MADDVRARLRALSDALQAKKKDPAFHLCIDCKSRSVGQANVMCRSCRAVHVNKKRAAGRRAARENETMSVSIGGRE